MIGYRWVFKTKLRVDETVECLKAILVAKGFYQVNGLDFSRAFSPIINLGSIHVVFSYALVQQWRIGQLNVKNIFLHRDLSEIEYMDQPLSFIHKSLPNHICKL